jgi:UDP-N-acetylglucosamine acyltransferase
MISNLAYVHPNVRLAENVTVEPFAYIAENVESGRAAG